MNYLRMFSLLLMDPRRWHPLPRSLFTATRPFFADKTDKKSGGGARDPIKLAAYFSPRAPLKSDLRWESRPPEVGLIRGRKLQLPLWFYRRLLNSLCGKWEFLHAIYLYKLRRRLSDSCLEGI